MALLDIFSGLGSAKSSPSKVVGIDIGASSIKVVELENRKDTVTLTTYGEVQLGPYGEQELGQTVSLDPKKEQSALIDVLRESAVKARNSVVAIPLSSSFVTIMTLDAKKEEDISGRIRVEARKYIPVPITDITLDWAEVELPENEQDSDKREVLLAAIQNDALERLRTLMSNVSMPNQPSEIECFSTIRALYEPDDDGVAMIDLGAISSKLFIAKQGLLNRMHRVRAGGSVATSRLAKTLDLPFAEAEVLKRSLEKDDKEYRDAANVHESCFERALQEFRKVIDEFEKRHGTELNRVMLTGGPVQFPSVPKLALDILERDIEIANPFNKVAYPAFMEDMLKEIGPSFTVALGAALRSFE